MSMECGYNDVNEVIIEHNFISKILLLMDFFFLDIEEMVGEGLTLLDFICYVLFLSYTSHHSNCIFRGENKH